MYIFPRNLLDVMQIYENPVYYIYNVSLHVHICGFFLQSQSFLLTELFVNDKLVERFMLGERGPVEGRGTGERFMGL